MIFRCSLWLIVCSFIRIFLLVCFMVIIVLGCSFWKGLFVIGGGRV